VLSENPWTRERARTTHALLTFVATDEEGKPRAVPALTLQNAFERKRFAAAKKRRAARLREKAHLDDHFSHRI
jgi:acyl-CoA hydrolase